MHKLDNGIIDREQAQYAAERFWIGALKNAVIDGDVTKGSLMAGQSVGLVDDVKPLKSIIDEMIDDAESELKRLERIFISEPACSWREYGSKRRLQNWVNSLNCADGMKFS